MSDEESEDEDDDEEEEEGEDKARDEKRLNFLAVARCTRCTTARTPLSVAQT